MRSMSELLNSEPPDHYTRIYEHLTNKPYPLRHREIAADLGIAGTDISKALGDLKKDGLIRRTGNGFYTTADAANHHEEDTVISIAETEKAVNKFFSAPAAAPGDVHKGKKPCKKKPPHKRKANSDVGELEDSIKTRLDDLAVTLRKPKEPLFQPLDPDDYHTIQAVLTKLADILDPEIGEQINTAIVFIDAAQVAALTHSA